MSQISSYIVKYASLDPETRRYGLLFLGSIGIGKSTSVYDAARRIAEKRGKTFVAFSLRWDPVSRNFVVNGGSVKDVLSDPSKYYILVEFRLSNIEPSDLTGVPRSHDGITYYDPQKTGANFDSRECQKM